MGEGGLWNHCPKGRWLRECFLGSGSTNTQTWTRPHHSSSQEVETNKLWFLLRLWLSLQAKWPWSGLSKGAETPSQRRLRNWSCLFILWGLHSRGYCRAPRNVQGKKRSSCIFLKEGAPWASEPTSPMKERVRMTMPLVQWLLIQCMEIPCFMVPLTPLNLTLCCPPPSWVQMQSSLKSLSLEAQWIPD